MPYDSGDRGCPVFGSGAKTIDCLSLMVRRDAEGTSDIDDKRDCDAAIDPK